jgi:hypothetical protein
VENRKVGDETPVTVRLERQREELDALMRKVRPDASHGAEGAYGMRICVEAATRWRTFARFGLHLNLNSPHTPLRDCDSRSLRGGWFYSRRQSSASQTAIAEAAHRAHLGSRDMTLITD